MSEETLPIVLARPGESSRSLADALSQSAGQPTDTLESVLRTNNALDPKRDLSGGTPLWVGPDLLHPPERERWWQERGPILRAFDGFPQGQRLAREDPWLLGPLSRFAERAQVEQWLTGRRLAQLGGYASTGASGYSTALHRELQGIASVADDVYKDVMSRFSGSRSPFGVSRSQSGALEQMLRSHPRYASLRRALEGLPRYVQRRLGDLSLPPGPRGNAEFVRRQIVVPRGVQPGAHLGRMSRLLGNEVLRVGRNARVFTWAVPAVIGVYNTWTAPEGQRLRTASGETVGVILGALGSAAGAGAGGVLIATGLVAGPGVIVFVASVIGAAAIGYGFYELGKTTGTFLHDVVSESFSDIADWFIEVSS